MIVEEVWKKAESEKAKIEKPNRSVDRPGRFENQSESNQIKVVFWNQEPRVGLAPFPGGVKAAWQRGSPPLAVFAELDGRAVYRHFLGLAPILARKL